MGCQCTQGAEVPSLPKRQKHWNSVCKKGLSTALHSYRASPWYLQELKILEDWPCAQESTYTKAERWQSFLQLSPESLYLAYKFEKSEEEHLCNLFDLLTSDFNDFKHPIAVLISAFVSEYTRDFAVPCETALQAQNNSQAAQLLLESSTVVLKYCSVLTTATIELYSTISLVLQQRKGDLEGLVMQRVLCTGLAQRLEALAEVVWQSSIKKLQAAADRKEELRRQVPASVSDFVLSEITAQFQYIANTANFHFRRQALANIQTQLPVDSAPLISLCILRAAAPHLPAQLHLSKLLLTDAPEVLDASLSAVDWLTL